MAAAGRGGRELLESIPSEEGETQDGPLDTEKIAEAEQELFDALEQLRIHHATSTAAPSPPRDSSHRRSRKRKTAAAAQGTFEELPWNREPNEAWDKLARRISEILREKKRHLVRCVVYTVGAELSLELLKATAVQVHVQGGLYYTRPEKKQEEVSRSAGQGEQEEKEREEDRTSSPPGGASLNIFQLQAQLSSPDNSKHGQEEPSVEQNNNHQNSAAPVGGSSPGGGGGGKKVRRTPGGTFIRLLRDRISEETWKDISRMSRFAFQEWQKSSRSKKRRRQQHHHRRSKSNHGGDELLLLSQKIKTTVAETVAE